MTEKEKMLAGIWYDANFNSELVNQRLVAEDLCFELNITRPSDTAKREHLLKKCYL